MGVRYWQNEVLYDTLYEETILSDENPMMGRGPYLEMKLSVDGCPFWQLEVLILAGSEY